MKIGIWRIFYCLVSLSTLTLLLFLAYSAKNDRFERSPDVLLLSLSPNFESRTATSATSVATKNETPIRRSIASSRPTIITLIYNSTLALEKKLDFSEKGNRRCLEYLLDHETIQYYYPPMNDDDNLDFNVKGIVTKDRLGPNFSDPLLVLKDKPPSTGVALSLLRGSCSEALLSFLPTLTAEDYDDFRYILKFFKHAANLTGMAYYLNYGSLLGHVRFSGRPTPWDDDVDIAIDYAKLETFKKICKSETKKLTTSNQSVTGLFQPSFSISRDRIKLFDGSNPRIQLYQHSFPFVDLFFFNSAVEDLYDLPEAFLMTVSNFSDAFHSSYSHSIAIGTMLPFRRERFLGLSLNVPARPKDFLKELDYVSTECRVKGYSHRYEKLQRGSRTIQCKDLVGFYDVNAIN